jgi:hypothetical protein
LAKCFTCGESAAASSRSAVQAAIVSRVRRIVHGLIAFVIYRLLSPSSDSVCR